MEFVGIEKQLFEELVRKFEYFEHRVMEICNRSGHGNLQPGERQDVAQVDGQSGRVPVSEHLAPHLADTP